MRLMHPLQKSKAMCQLRPIAFVIIHFERFISQYYSAVANGDGTVYVRAASSWSSM